MLLFVVDLNINVWFSGQWYWYDVLYLNVSCICISIIMFELVAVCDVQREFLDVELIK